MSETLELAALGRPFQLGMLYDCRSDTLIPGVTLWDLQTLQSNLDCSDRPSTEFHIIASDSMESKSAALNVSRSLKASFLGGLVEVNGSAKYLSDTKASKQQARVTLQYKTTTRFDQLTMNHLGRQNITYPSVFDEGSATHVVTAVLYGAQAFFVFDQVASSAENAQKMQGNMEAIIKLLSSIKIQGKASLEMSEEQKSCAEKFSCTFYGDFSPRNNPTTFKDAISIYATLPNLLGAGGEHSVPITVWLYPLNKLVSKAAQLVRGISVGLVNRCQCVLEQLTEAVIRCNDLMKDSVAIQFPEIGQMLQHFRDMCLEYTQVFQENLAGVLPSIRGGREEEGLLANILNNTDKSPFKHQSLVMWLDDEEREMKVVRRYLSVFKDVPIVKTKSELDDKLMDQATDYVVCFMFTTLHRKDFYLSEADNYLRSITAQKMQMPPSADGACATGHSEHWFNSRPVSQKMKEQSKSFLDFATANEADEKVKFIVSSVQNDSNEGASIYLYEEEFVLNESFVPPSQPAIPTLSGRTHDSVTLQFQAPRCGTGEIVGYKVEYRVSQQEEWTILDTPHCHSFTIPGLQPHQEYHFRYRAVTKVGVSKASESYRGITRPASPPGNLVFQDGSPTPTLHWDRPGQIGAGVKIFWYIIEYREEPSVQANMERKLWEEVKLSASQCHYSLVGLKPGTVYSVRVSAGCGEAGSSATSEEVLIEIKNAKNRIALELLGETPIISIGNPSIYKLNLQNEVVNKSKQFVKWSFGKYTKAHKMLTIMVLGATGSGKTTLINGMINYILGVEWGDHFRYKLIQEETGKSQAESQTSSITAYQLHHQEGFNIDYSLTIIDTPGFGDTRGISRDKQIIDDIRELFAPPQGIDQINAVCFVVQAALARLTHTQTYVFDSILAIFGKDIAENIRILITFADGERPPILDALKVADVPCPKDKTGMPMYFKFNNSAIFAQHPKSENTGNLVTSGDSRKEEDDNNKFAAINWNMGENSMRKFFTALNTMEAKSLCLTRKVLKERKQLEAIVEGLQIQVKAGLTKLEELRKTQQVLDQNQANLDENKDFEYEVNVLVKERKFIPYLSNTCEQCEFTCDAPCLVVIGPLGKLCTSMDSLGKCTVCPQKCDWTNHKRQFSRVVCRTKKEKRTYNALKERYEKGYGVMMTQQKVKESLEQEYDAVHDKVLELIQQSSRSLKRLDKIALRPNPLSTPAYIDLMILDERNYAKPGFMERIEALTTVKCKAELQEKVAKKEKLLPELSKDDPMAITSATIKPKQLFSNVMSWFNN